MESKINLAREKLKITYPLKDKQIETLKALDLGNDCISILPTGYGKSLIFQMLPWVLMKDEPGIVIVICPLTSIMQDQVMTLKEKGIRTSFVNLQGTVAYSYNSDNEDSDESKPQTVNMEMIKSGDIEILYSHPEAMFTPVLSRILRRKVFQQKVCCIAVDEVHMIEEWGEDFRPKFKQIGELTALFPNAAHLAVTATATPSCIQSLSKILQYINPTIIKVNPDRPNLFLEIKTRLSNLQKFSKYDDIVVPLAQELKTKREKFPLTIVYVESLEALGYFYQFINYELKEEQYIGEAIPENRIFGQFHKDYTSQMKQHILFELRKEEPKLRLVLATVALGMGLDAPAITRIIHCRPPTTLEKYFQEVGRAGRKGQKAEALMYYNNNDLAKNRKGLSDAMVQYCKTKDKCLRLQLLQYFGFNETKFNGPMYECCSYCRQLQ
ncbi:ATP-dependent DNA helicase Q1-like [Mytilus galloprovincialis]|uniref:ATP-dependent DNA helicase Q1-like n=1 Tax=Mytilus galloprovincialis TaxID=29158 RepID=UPI003F7BD049